MTITQDSPTTFTIGGLSALTGGDGNYTLTVSAAGISDFFGDVGTGSQSTSWATGTDVPVVVSVGAGNPTLIGTRRCDTVDVVLSEPIDPASFDDSASQPDAQWRAEPDHLRRHGHRDRSRRPTRSAASPA